MGNVDLARTDRRVLLASAVWIVLSLVFLDMAIAKVMDLQAAHQSVNGLRYAQVAFWIALLAFWVWSLWRSWTRYRAQGKVV